MDNYFQASKCAQSDCIKICSISEFVEERFVQNFGKMKITKTLSSAFLFLNDSLSETVINSLMSFLFF